MAEPTVNSEKTVLVLQGGGALGAYQGGAYEALATAGIEPDWVAGILEAKGLRVRIEPGPEGMARLIAMRPL